MTLQTERLRTMEQLRAFVEGAEAVDCQPKDRAAAYELVRRALVRFDYHRLGRADRGCVRAYIGKVCGFSAAQTTRLIRQQAETGVVVDRRARNSGRPFATVYTPADIRERRGQAPRQRSKRGRSERGQAPADGTREGDRHPDSDGDTGWGRRRGRDCPLSGTAKGDRHLLRGECPGGQAPGEGDRHPTPLLCSGACL